MVETGAEDRPPRAASHQDAMAVLRRDWDRSSAVYDSMPAHGRLSPAEREAWRHLLALFLPPSHALAVLDVGTGTGFFAVLAAALGHQVIGVDLAPGMLEAARDNARRAGLDIAFHEADVHDLPFSSGSFDVVISRHVLWTLPDPVRAISQWARVTVPGGRVLAVDGFWHAGSRAGKALAAADAAIRRLRQPSRPAGRHLTATVYQPLMGVRDTAPASNAFERAGLHDVRAEALAWIDDVERRAMSPRARLTFASRHYLVEGTVPVTGRPARGDG